MEPRRPQLLDAGLFLLLVAVPIAFFPLSLSPFGDVKLPLLAAGTLLVWLSGVPADRKLALPAAVWVGASVVAALAGVDPTASILGAPNQDTGLVMLVACGCLIALGPNLPEATVARARRWLVGAGLVVATVGAAWRIAPDAFHSLTPGLRYDGSTLGNPIYAAAFLAVCVPAALTDPSPSRRRLALIFTVLTLGFAANGERSALLLPLVAFVASAWLLRVERARLLLAAGTLVVVMAGWALVSSTTSLLSGPTGVVSSVGQFETLSGEHGRLVVFTADLRAFTGRPVLGWGPGNTWSAYLSSVSASEIRTTGRGWGDAHDIFLEVLVSTGLIGTAAFLWLLVFVARRFHRPPPGLAWVAVAGLTLLVFHLYEPYDLVLTPLLFLFAGVVARPKEAPVPLVSGGARAARASVVGRVVVGVLLATTAVVSGLALTASALQQWAKTHYDEGALRLALTLQPWRLPAAEDLALNLALDGRAGDQAAEDEARDMVATWVAEHPWNPGVRLAASDVERLLRNLEGAQDWVEQQLVRFPNDTVRVANAPTISELLASG